MICITHFILACTKTNKNDLTTNNSETPDYYFASAMIEFENKNYDLALELFKELEINFPLSNEAVQAQIMSAFIDYVQMNYNEAIFKLNRIINRYPSYKDIDYVYYIRAVCYYEQIENQYLDGQKNILALDNFQQIINRFPDSKYAKDSQQKIILIKESIAAKHMSVGMFYLKRKKYLAALKRYKKIIDDYSQTKFTPEALHRLVEIYYTLGMIDDAKKTASVLGYNYPDTKWYKYSYKIVSEKNTPVEKNKSFFKKILKPFSKENEGS